MNLEKRIKDAQSLLKYMGEDKNGLRSKTKESGGSKTVCYKKWRNSFLKKAYGITLLDFEKMKRQQKNKCAICKNKFKNSRTTHIDYCHKTGKVRGLLCNNCNFMIGLAKDDPETLESASRYLKSFDKKVYLAIDSENSFGVLFGSSVIVLCINVDQKRWRGISCRSQRRSNPGKDGSHEASRSKR